MVWEIQRGPSQPFNLHFVALWAMATITTAGALTTVLSTIAGIIPTIILPARFTNAERNARAPELEKCYM